MNDQVLTSFKKDFLAIKQKGFIESMRSHNTGIGKTFEELMRIHENNNQLADYKDILELKSHRDLSGSMITLFTKSPTHPKGANEYLRQKYGKRDSTAAEMKILHTTLSATRFNTFDNRVGFRLAVDLEEQKIFILVKDLKSGKILNETIYYSFDELSEIIEKKCKYIAYVTAKHKEEKGKELFHFEKAQILTGLTFDKFIKLIQDGLIVYDFRIGVYRSGRNKGKTHDHGSGFRFLKRHLRTIFDVEEV